MMAHLDRRRFGIGALLHDAGDGHPLMRGEFSEFFRDPGEIGGHGASGMGHRVERADPALVISKQRPVREALAPLVYQRKSMCVQEDVKLDR
jgi:hypothetical protein